MHPTIGIPGGEVWGLLQRVVGVGFPVENEGQREGGGEAWEWGGDRQKNSPECQFACVCQNYPLATAVGRTRITRTLKLFWY